MFPLLSLIKKALTLFLLSKDNFISVIVYHNLSADAGKCEKSLSKYPFVKRSLSPLRLGNQMVSTVDLFSADIFVAIARELVLRLIYNDIRG